MHPANGRRRYIKWCYNVTSSLSGWAHTQNDPCYGCWCPGSLHRSSSHQQLWYWLQRINGSLSSAGRDFNYLCHLNCLETIENSNILLYSLKLIELSYGNTCQIWMWYLIDNRTEEVGLVTPTPDDLSVIVLSYPNDWMILLMITYRW